LSYSWTVVNQPAGSNASLSAQSGETASFTPEVTGEYIIELLVSDGTDDDADETGVEATLSAVEISSDIMSDRTLQSDNRYLVTGQVGVGESAIGDFEGERTTLTIEPGTEILFEEEALLIAQEGGAIVAGATEQEPISMTGTSEEPGWWKGVLLKGGNNVFDHVDLRHAGSRIETGVFQISAGISVGYRGSLELTNSTIVDTEGFGVGYEPTNGDKYASIEALAGNTFERLGDAPLQVPFEQIGAFDGTNSFPSESAIEVIGQGGNDIRTEVTVRNLGIPYRIDGTLNVTDGRLLVDPGVKMQFEEEGGLEVFGATEKAEIVAEGTASDPITMRATEGNEQQGWWNGILLEGTYEGTLTNIVVRHGGNGGNASDFVGAIELSYNSLDQDPRRLNLTSSRIEESGANGIYCAETNVNLNVEGTTFSGIEQQDIKNCGTSQ
jgi:hypothetical protein